MVDTQSTGIDMRGDGMASFVSVNIIVFVSNGLLRRSVYDRCHRYQEAIDTVWGVWNWSVTELEARTRVIVGTLTTMTMVGDG